MFGAATNKESIAKTRVESTYSPPHTIALDSFAAATKSRRRFAHQGASTGDGPIDGAGAVPARGFANRSRAASGPARPALRPGCEELAAGARTVRALSQKAQPEAEPGVKLGECRDGAPKGERARKRMSAVTRNIRGARRTG